MLKLAANRLPDRVIQTAPLRPKPTGGYIAPVLHQPPGGRFSGIQTPRRDSYQSIVGLVNFAQLIVWISTKMAAASCVIM